MNREEYLNTAARWYRDAFSAAGYPLPDNIRMTCGFPKGRSKAIGQAWTDMASDDKHYEIFVSPAIAETNEVLGILVHELAHVAVGLDKGHKGPFVRAVRAMHLDGKPKATVPSETFKRIAAPLIEEIGEYPHASLHAMGNGLKKQTTRLLKCECQECGYVARVTAKWIDAEGAPVCPRDEIPLQVAA